VIATGKYPAQLDAILAEAGIAVVLSGVRMPRMNSIMERWIQASRHELLDRTLIWSQAHLLHAPGEYERHHNRHRPHRGMANARPLHPLPELITDPRHDQASAHPPTRSARRNPPRIRTRRLSCTDEIVGTHRSGVVSVKTRG
jgi:transposase InsO family protein